MDSFESALILVGFTFVILSWGLFLIAGRMLDPIYRVRQMRRFLRRNWLVLYLVSKDAKTIQPRVINADEDAFTYKNNLFVVEKGKIYRKTQSDIGGKPALDKDGKPIYEKQGGFSFSPEEGQKPVKYEEGTPVIFADNEHIKPVDFYGEESKVTPSGVGSALNAWVTNQISKGLQGNEQKNKYILFVVIAACLLLLANIALTYKAMESSNAIGANCEIKTTNDKGTVQNGTLIITQKTKAEGVQYVGRVSGL